MLSALLMMLMYLTFGIVLFPFSVEIRLLDSTRESIHTTARSSVIVDDHSVSAAAVKRGEKMRYSILPRTSVCSPLVIRYLQCSVFKVQG